MNRVYLSLGSNIDKEYNLPAAVRLLSERGKVIAVSTAYETVPAASPGQPNFLNAALLMETGLTPQQIKDQIIEEVEQALGRRRQANKNAPRTIDIDITLFNDAVLDYVPADGRTRHIPDRDLLRSPHMIVPIAELAPDLIHPISGERLDSIAAHLMAESSAEQVIWPRDEIDLAF